jgi:hypothetical protein
VLSKADERSLVLFGRRVLRCSFGALQDEGTWSKGHNHKLYKLFIELDINKYINRLSWAGHVARMENSRTVKKVFDTRHEGIGKSKGTN